MIRCGMTLALLSFAMLSSAIVASTPSRAQVFASYVCDDGTQVSAAFFPKEKNVRMQVGGRTFSLPQRLSADGGRYAKAGVSFWVKGQQATLKRPKMKNTICRTQ